MAEMVVVWVRVGGSVSVKRVGLSVGSCSPMCTSAVLFELATVLSSLSKLLVH